MKAYKLLYMNKDEFMKKLLSSKKKKQFYMTAFDEIIKKTEEMFYRENNDFCIANGLNNNLFLVMKNHVKKNDCDHVAVQFNLDKKFVQKFITHHNKEIYALLYNSDRDILITGGYDQSICVYNCSTKKLIKQVIVEKGIIHCLLLKSNVLFIGGCNIVSIYLLDSPNNNNQRNDDNNNNNSHMDKSQSNINDVCDVSLITHIEILPQKNKKVNFITFTDCGDFDFWLSGNDSNKIYRVVFNQKYNSNLFRKSSLIISESY